MADVVRRRACGVPVAPRSSGHRAPIVSQRYHRYESFTVPRPAHVPVAAVSRVPSVACPVTAGLRQARGRRPALPRRRACRTARATSDEEGREAPARGRKPAIL